MVKRSIEWCVKPTEIKVSIAPHSFIVEMPTSYEMSTSCYVHSSEHRRAIGHMKEYAGGSFIAHLLGELVFPGGSERQ